MEQKYSPEELIKKYNNGTCSDEERAIVETWHLHDLSESTFKPRADKINAANVKGRKAIIAHAGQARNVRTLWPRLTIAAAILVCLSIGGYFLLSQPGTQIPVQKTVSDIMPGGNRAILTLANGRQIVLNGARIGKIAVQGKTAISKSAEGNIAYNPIATAAESANEISYNSLSTPVGGQYHLIMADGTKVWLNAASSIKYPTSFPSNERRVEITGEVYFEVAHNAQKPFKVVSKGQRIEVLGTHFNVNAYADEAETRTTLLEGSVKVFAASNAVIIKPGQQFIAKNNWFNIKQADVDEAVAWKNGYFQFNDEKIESVMRKLARWYDIDVRYQGKISTEGFNGPISRFKSIKQVLGFLEKTGAVHFKIEGRRVTVI